VPDEVFAPVLPPSPSKPRPNAPYTAQDPPRRGPQVVDSARLVAEAPPPSFCAPLFLPPNPLLWPTSTTFPPILVVVGKTRPVPQGKAQRLRLVRPRFPMGQPADVLSQQGVPAG